MAAADHATRIELVEHKIGTINVTLENVVAGLNAVKEVLLSMPKQSSTRDRMTTIAATLAIYTAFLALANQWLSAQISPDRQTLARVEKSVDGLEVLRYRLSLLEKTNVTAP